MKLSKLHRSKLGQCRTLTVERKLQGKVALYLLSSAVRDKKGKVKKLVYDIVLATA